MWTNNLISHACILIARGSELVFSLFFNGFLSYGVLVAIVSVNRRDTYISLYIYTSVFFIGFLSYGVFVAIVSVNTRHICVSDAQDTAEYE